MKISIIVPVYNCEAYLRCCIDSLLAQTYCNIEIILVNDGSTDSSGSICNSYDVLDDRIVVLHQENAGVSAARNAGLRICTGEYIMFVDADDWIDPDACSKIVNFIDRESLLYLWNIRVIRNEKVELQKKIHVPATIQEFLASIIAASKDQNPYIRASWGKLFKRELITNIHFPEDLYIGEDACFLLKCVKQVHSINEIRVFSDAWYNYRIIPISAVRRYKDDLLEQSIKQYNYILSQISFMNIENEKIINTAMNMFCWRVLVSIKRNEMKGKKRTGDCRKWMKVSSACLKSSNIEKKQLSKFNLLCWKLSNVISPAMMEGLVGLYVRYDKRKKRRN